MSKNPKTPLLIVSLAVLGLAAGCVTDPKQKTAETKKADQDEYVWITPTGSRMPVKVKKGTSAGTTANQKGVDELRNQQTITNEAKYATPGGG